jgi:hypothetical protein
MVRDLRLNTSEFSYFFVVPKRHILLLSVIMIININKNFIETNYFYTFDKINFIKKNIFIILLHMKHLNLDTDLRFTPTNGGGGSLCLDSDTDVG